MQHPTTEHNSQEMNIYVKENFKASMLHNTQAKSKKKEGEYV